MPVVYWDNRITGESIHRDVDVFRFSKKFGVPKKGRFLRRFQHYLQRLWEKKVPARLRWVEEQERAAVAAADQLAAERVGESRRTRRSLRDVLAKWAHVLR